MVKSIRSRVGERAASSSGLDEVDRDRSRQRGDSGISRGAHNDVGRSGSSSKPGHERVLPGTATNDENSHVCNDLGVESKG